MIKIDFNLNKKKGITLITLVIIIIVILILAAITISIINNKENIISISRVSKQDAIKKNIEEYVLAKYQQIITHTNLVNNEDILNLLEQKILEDNSIKDSIEHFTIKSKDLENYTITIEHQGVEFTVDLKKYESGELIYLSEDDKQKGYTIFFDYKDGNVFQRMMVCVEENQTIQASLTPEQNVIIQGKDWTPILELNNIVIQNARYREKINNVVTYVVSFDLNGGNIAGQTTLPDMIVEENAIVSSPGTPTKQNYVFDGWNPNFGSPIINDTTYTAQWSVAAQMCTYTYDLDGGYSFEDPRTIYSNKNRRIRYSYCSTNSF